MPGAYAVGQAIGGRYEVKAVLGQGPIGIVYRALDREIEVEVVVKVVNKKLLQTDEERAAFRREAHIARGLSHPGIVRVYEEGLDDDQPYIVMQHLEGLTLRKIIDLRHGKGQRFGLKEIEPIFQQLTTALDFAHEQRIEGLRGVAHGDLKPDNVMVLPDLLKVTDFREACFVPRVPFVAAQKVRGGAERYLAPEVIAGQAITPAADIYSLGVLFGEMLGGEAYDPARGLDLHVANPDLPRAADGIFKRLTAARPEDRYAHAGQLADDISALIAGETPDASSPRRDKPLPPPPPLPSPHGAKADEPAEVLGTGDFELVDDEGSSEAPARVRNRVSFGLEKSGPHAKPGAEDSGSDLHVLDDEILDDDVADDYDDVPTEMGEALPLKRPPPPVDEAASGARLDDAPFGESDLEDELSLDDDDVLESGPAPPELPADDTSPGGAPAPHQNALADLIDDVPTSVNADAYTGPDEDVPTVATADAFTGFPGPGVEGPTRRARVPLQPPAVRHGGPVTGARVAGARGGATGARKKSSWPMYVGLALAGVAVAAVGLSFTPQGAAILARLRGGSGEAGGTEVATSGAATGGTPAAGTTGTATAGGAAIGTGTGTAGTPAAGGSNGAAGNEGATAGTHPGETGTPPSGRHAPPPMHPKTHEALAHETPHPPHPTHVRPVHTTPVHQTHETPVHEVAHVTPPVHTHPKTPKHVEVATAHDTHQTPIPPDHTDVSPPDHTETHDTNPDHGTEVASVTPTPAGSGGHCPRGMVYVPAGSFQIGSAINDPMRNFAEISLHDVNVKAFCVDRYEYGGYGHKPLTSVSWYQARSICKKHGKRLCSEAEWEKACKGPHDYRFPYGNVYSPTACNTEDSAGNDRSVTHGGAFKRCRSGYGAYDMSGNVSEWTSSKFQKNLTDRTQKGGAANRPDWDTRCAARGNRKPNSKDRFLGFRCCASPE